MKTPAPTPAQIESEQIARLVATLQVTEQRIEELTAGEIDAVSDAQGRPHLLRKAQEQLRRADSAKQSAILAALPASVALLDRDGTVVSVNETWRRFGAANDLRMPLCGVGADYLDVCDRAHGADSDEAPQVAAGIRSVLRDGAERFEIEYPCHSPAEQRWFLMSATRLGAEAPGGAVVMHVDITARKASEAVLQRFRTAMDTTADAILLVSRKTMLYVECNATACTMLGYSREELLALGPAQTSGLTTARLEQVYDRLIAGEANNELTEMTALHKDGSRRVVEARRQAVRAGDEDIIVVVLRDIAERKRAELEMQQALRRLNEAQRIGRIGDWAIDFATQAISWSPQVYEIYGRDRARGPPGSYAEYAALLEPESQAVQERMIARAIASGEPQEYEHTARRDNGEPIHMQAVAVPVIDASGTVRGLRGTVQDISARKCAEATLWASELRYHALFQGMIEGYAYCSTVFEGDALVDFTYVEVNPAFETLTGLSDVVGRKVSVVIPGILADQPELFELYGNVALTGLSRRLETYVRALDIWLLLRVHSQERGHFVAVFENVTEQKRAESALQDSRDRLALATASAQIGIWDWDVVTNTLTWDARMYALYGIEELDFGGVYEAWQAGLHPDDRERVDRDIHAALEGGAEYTPEFRVVWPTGEVRYLEAHAVVQRSASGQPTRMVGTNRDVTEQRNAADRIRRLNRVHTILSRINNLCAHAADQEELFRDACRIAVEDGGFTMALIALVDQSSAAIMPVASAGGTPGLFQQVRDLLSSDGAAATMVGRAIAQQRALVSNDVGADPRLVFGQKYAEAGVCSLAVLPLIVGEAAVGAVVLSSSTSDAFHDEEMQLLGELTTDIAFTIDHIEKSERLTWLGYFDELTGLANRNLFVDRVAQRMRASGDTGRKLALIVVDVERFRITNEKLGRRAGDALLKQVGQCLVSCVGDSSLVARIGGDQFAIVFSTAQDEDVTRHLERTIACYLEHDFEIDGTAVRLGARFGVATWPEDGDTAEALIRSAEHALKIAKSSRKAYAFHSSEMSARIAQRSQVEEELRTAVREGQFLAMYQARVDMTTGRIVGAEALVRWRHPVKGVIGPGDFIALAEETGLIVPIGAWMIDCVCAQQAAWIAAGVAVVPIAVNVSSIQFEQDNLLHTVKQALAMHRLEASHLELELTESAVMADPVGAASMLTALRTLGVGLALDDFGTGYSSLSHLRRLPFNAVKIDGSFVADITSNVGDAAIATAIIAMAHRLKLRVVAEGVETQGQFNYLRLHGCDEMQGHLFSAAVEPGEFEASLRNAVRMRFSDPDPADQRTLLVVDDEEGIRNSLKRLFRNDGYRVFTAASGAEGLEALSLNAVQVIISDQRMPGMSGTEFFATVKELYPETVRIILSGYTDLDVVTESVNRGAVFKFLTKPWDGEQLREQVRDAFRRYRARVAQ